MSQTNTPAATPEQAERFDVQLLKPHTHAGKDHQAGATINVTARQRTFLAKSEVIASEAK